MAKGTASQKLRIFLSYRREDAAAHAGRLYDSLAEHFGPSQLFMDVDKIALGSDFAADLRKALTDCDVVIAVMGRGWLNATDKEGRRRLDNPEDFVRLELEAALQRDVRLIPVMVQDAELPSPAELPPSMRALPGRQALEISDRRWRSDVAELIQALQGFEDTLPHAMPPSSRGVTPSSASSRRKLIAAGALIIAAVATAVAVTTGPFGDRGDETAHRRIGGALSTSTTASTTASSLVPSTTASTVTRSATGRRTPPGPEVRSPTPPSPAPPSPAPPTTVATSPTTTATAVPAPTTAAQGAPPVASSTGKSCPPRAFTVQDYAQRTFQTVYDCSTYTPSDVYTNVQSSQAGEALEPSGWMRDNRSRVWVICQFEGRDNPPLRDNTKVNFNHWWLYTQGDEVRTNARGYLAGWGYLPATALNQGEQNERVPGVPDCPQYY